MSRKIVTIVPVQMLVWADFDTCSDISSGLNPKVYTAAEHRFSYQYPRDRELEARKSSSHETYDFITISDDDEQSIAETTSIDLGSDDESSIECLQIGPNRAAVIGAQQSDIRPVTEAQSPYKHNIPDPAKQPKKAVQPLFRVLTKDEIPAPNVQPVPETHSMGFKAWYKNHDAPSTGNATTPATTQTSEKRLNQKPSISIVNEERTKNNKTRIDRDAPNFAMAVLNPKRKRTMAELDYNQLISPSQIESPSEKLARRARKRRLRESGLDTWSDKATGLDHAHDYEMAETEEEEGEEEEEEEEEESEVHVSPVMHGISPKRESVVSVGNGRSGDSVIRKSPVNPNLLADNYRGLFQKHDGDDALVSFIDRASRTPAGRKRRVSGPTSVCGVFSPEKKPPVKNITTGPFHCPRCDSQYSRPSQVNYHFEGCIARYGNPRSLRWNDHPSLLGKGEKVALKEKNAQIPTSPARMSAIQGVSARDKHVTRPMVRFDPVIEVITPSPALQIRASEVLIPPEKQLVAEEQRLCAGNEVKRDHDTTTVEHRAIVGKGPFAETLKTFRETETWSGSDDLNAKADEDEYEESEVLDIAYRYLVQRREWLETEEDAVETSIGPYYTLNEANAVAKAEVQYPQTDGFGGVEPRGWSYYYHEDENGIQTHLATVLDISIEAVVHRGKLPLFGSTCPLRSLISRTIRACAG